MNKVSESDRITNARLSIIETATQLLKKEGQAALTTRAVAHAANIKAPVIYRLFGDKDGLLDAIAEYILETIVVAKSSTVQNAAVENVDPLVDLRSAWDRQVAFGLVNPSLFLLLAEPKRQVNSLAAKEGNAILARRIHRIALVGKLQVSEQQAVSMVRAAATGAVMILLSMPAGAQDNKLADNMYQAVMRVIINDFDSSTEPSHFAAATYLKASIPTLDTYSEAEKTLLNEWLERITSS